MVKETLFEIGDFWKNGFAGPFSLNFPLNELNLIEKFVAEMISDKAVHPIYRRYSMRDWHLVNPMIMNLFKNEELISQLKKLLGPNLMLWRSKIFNKMPFEGEIGWHQEWGAFNGEEIGNDIPALTYSGTEEYWDLTVWISLTDISVDMAPIRFARGSHNKRYPIDMVPLYKSEFFTNPFTGVNGKEELIKRALSNSLILDIDTSKVFNDTDLYDEMSLEEAKIKVLRHIENAQGAITLEFNPIDYEIVHLEMNKGDYWIFTERVMHGSGLNTSKNGRMAINGRITKSETLVYPSRLNGQFIDGSNLDVRNHKCVILSGNNWEEKNIYY